MKNIMNKKAILMPEVLRIIIAVLCIVLLIMLASNLYSLFTRSSEIEQAKATLNEIVSKANFLSEMGDTTDLLITAPAEWALTSFNEQVCICKFESIGDFQNDRVQQEKECSSTGVCRKIKMTLNSFCGSTGNCLKLTRSIDSQTKLPFELFITKSSNGFILTTLPYSDVVENNPSQGTYTQSLDSVRTDLFVSLIKNYVESPTLDNQNKIIANVNANPIVAEAISKGYNWNLELTGSGFTPKIIYSYDSSNQCASTDSRTFDGISTSNSFVNLIFKLCN